jgi:hypothetical protein
MYIPAGSMLLGTQSKSGLDVEWDMSLIFSCSGYTEMTIYANNIENQ